MLQNLHVKNLALMEETEIELQGGLNILTGETGAGKSLLIGSVNLALGAKFEKEMLRKESDTAFVELTFDGNEAAALKLQEMDIEANDDGSILISRKMQASRSTFKINGESVSAKQIKELAEVLIDIHGQHEHQSLLKKSKHLEILDAFCGSEIHKLLGDVSAFYKKVKELQKALEEQSLDAEGRNREISLAEFEVNEIMDAALVPGEDEELEKAYSRMVNAKKIKDDMAEAVYFCGNESDNGAGSGLNRAIRALSSVVQYDPALENLESQLLEIDDLLNGFLKDAEGYLRQCDFEEEEFLQTEERLNLLNHLKSKYGNSLEKVIAYGEKRRKDLEKLQDYDAYLDRLRKELEQKTKEYNASAKELSKIRKEMAGKLEKKLQEALIHLNFLTVQFEVSTKDLPSISEKGIDDIEFLISVNPGEAVRPLGLAASGGELSRIMLAIKTVLAEKDQIDTLIFDEIDTGISGITAWKVAEQLHQVACAHQVICITHLPQIAAMGDAHYVIEKNSFDNKTITDVRLLAEQESTKEVARLLGSDNQSDAAIENATQLKNQADEYKKNFCYN